MTSYIYLLYGLPLHSELVLPELREQNSGLVTLRVEPVQIIEGTVPKHLPNSNRANPQFEFTSDECLYRVDGIAEYWISNGSRIVVQAMPGAKDYDVRAFLFGSIIGALLHQRNLLPLHVSALESPVGVVAFTGHSGAGKSTLAAMVHRLTDWPMLCDDVAVIHPEDYGFGLHAGMVRLKLWSDAIERLDLGREERFPDSTREDKFHVFSNRMFTDAPGPMTSLFMIDVADAFSIEPVRRADAFGAITKTIYRPELIDIFNDRAKILSMCVGIAGKTKVYRYGRPWNPKSIAASTEQLIEFILKDDRAQS